MPRRLAITFAEVYCRRHPEQALWLIWKPRRELVCVRLLASGEEMEFDTLTEALSAIASYAVNQPGCAPAMRPEVDAQQ